MLTKTCVLSPSVYRDLPDLFSFMQSPHHFLDQRTELAGELLVGYLAVVVGIDQLYHLVDVSLALLDPDRCQQLLGLGPVQGPVSVLIELVEFLRQELINRTGQTAGLPRRPWWSSLLGGTVAGALVLALGTFTKQRFTTLGNAYIHSLVYS